MFRIVIFALLLQGTAAGPKNLQVADDAKIMPPLIVPAGTTIPVALVNSITTKTAKDCGGVYVPTTFPATGNNKIVIPVVTSIKGKITEVNRAGRVKGKADLMISFQTLILPS